MKNKILVKSKVVLEDDGKTLITYLWKKTFWIFGYWYPFGTVNGFSKLPEDRINRIDDTLVSKVLFDNVLKEPCEHLEWDMDNQIRTIKCNGCGKKASVKNIKD